MIYSSEAPSVLAAAVIVVAVATTTWGITSAGSVTSWGIAARSVTAALFRAAVSLVR